MDPLSLLREYTMSKRVQEISLIDGECVFGKEYRFPRTMETAYRKRDGGRYTVETLVVLVKNLELKHSDYIKRAYAENVPLVTFTDRKALQEFLEGKISTTDAIELLAPVAPPSILPESRNQSSASAPPHASAATPLKRSGTADYKSEKRQRPEGQKGMEASDLGADVGGSSEAPRLAWAGEGEVGAGGEQDEELRRILGQERPLRTMEELMLCPKGPAVFANVLVLLENWERERKQEKLRKQKEAAAGSRGYAPSSGRPANTDSRSQPRLAAHRPGPTSGGSKGGPGAVPAGVPRGAVVGGGLSNPEEKRFWKEYIGTDAAEALGIDPTQSFTHAAPAPSSLPADVSRVNGAPAQPADRGPKPERVQPPGSAGAELAAAGRPSNASKAVEDPPAQHPVRGHAPHREGRAQLHAPSRSGGSRPGSGHLQRSGREGGRGGRSTIPIILVPSAQQTLVNMSNVREFLEEGVFVAPEERARALAGQPRADVIHIRRTLGRDPPVTYEVRDKTASLSAQDWERVAAVFVLGKEWQFKGWPFKDSVEALSHVMGVYVRYEDDSAQSAGLARQWNCQFISLSRYKRHQDRTNVLTFWSKLDAFLRARKSSLVF